ncbi:MAG TPA: CRISPR-associated helicase Cas3', partial [Dehalococcoidia bacterium]|nr:CRISPR-associated helicase Cas3' [Dehalococcoidia bacterium]
TERHFTPQNFALRSDQPPLTNLWPRLETFIAGLARNASDTNHPVHQVRQNVYRDCVQAAALPPGVFKLIAPTGGGKTLSSMAFALQHALQHGLERVIVAIPYTSIIEQTADQYVRIFGEKAVLEHHSAVDVDDPDEDLSPAHVQARLASQNWDVPIVVTTTVQLFDSIFANRSSRMRKLHNLARSVLILDEVQTLPPELLDPILDALQELTAHYSTTVVLCSATVPDYTDTPYGKNWPQAHDIVAQPEHHFEALHRVRYELLAGEASWDEVAQWMRAEPQCMAVVNTRNDALALVKALADSDVLHLSTWLCGKHRREVLAQVRHRLKSGLPCRLVATQVVEAGVDLDFPVVFRALGPLDRIVQAAGRCNREGKLAYGRVVVFNPPGNHAPPGEYRAGMDTTQRLLNQGFTHLDSPATHRRYFKEWYNSVETDKNGIQKLRQELRFAEVARKFHLIGEESIPAVVDYHLSDGAQWALAHIKREGRITTHQLRVLQPYLVGLRQREVAQLEQQTLLRPITEGLWEWAGQYDPRLGIGKARPDPGQWIV